MSDYLIYAEWPVVHSDPIGLEARRDPQDPAEYGINRIWGDDEILPMLLLDRGTLPNIATTTLDEGNSLIERNAYHTNKENTEFRNFLTLKNCSVNTLNAFIKATYIQLAREGKIII